MAEKAFDLVRELTRSTDTMIPFNDDSVRCILEEMNAAFDENHRDALTYQDSHNRDLLPIVNYRHALLLRNKRCLLAYLYARLQKLKEIRWNMGPTLLPEIKAALNEPEIQWFNNYSKILANYMIAISDEHSINLTEDIKPPKSLFIEVRCLVDYGKFELESGEVISFKKNTQHYLPKRQVEQLIRQGILQHIT